MTIADADWPYRASLETEQALTEAEAAWKIALRNETDAMIVGDPALVSAATAAQAAAYDHWMQTHALYIAECKAMNKLD